MVGYNTPSRKLEIFSKTMADWKWPEFALPEYYRSHIHRSAQGASMGKPAEDFDPKYMPRVEWPKDAHGDVYTLLPIFRLPNLIHTRSGNAKYLYEISHKNPLWVNPVDAKQLGDIRTGDLLKVHTEIGYFVLHAWVTEGLTPGVVACSHHLGRWRVNKDDQIERMSSAWVDLKEVGKGNGRCASSPASSLTTARSGHQARLVERCRRAPGHHLPGPSRSHQRHALLASTGARRASRPGRSLRRHFCGHQSFARRVSRWKALARPAPGPEVCAVRYGFRAFTVRKRRPST